MTIFILMKTLNRNRANILAIELLYFRIADKCNIIDKPNERSSHSSIVLRGGGILGFRLI